MPGTSFANLHHCRPYRASEGDAVCVCVSEGGDMDACMTFAHFSKLLFATENKVLAIKYYAEQRLRAFQKK